MVSTRRGRLPLLALVALSSAARGEAYQTRHQIRLAHRWTPGEVFLCGFESEHVESYLSRRNSTPETSTSHKDLTRATVKESCNRASPEDTIVASTIKILDWYHEELANPPDTSLKS